MEPLTTASLALLDDASAQSISSRPPRSRAFSFSSISTLTTLPDSDEGEEGDDEESSRSEAEEEEVQPKAKKQRVNNNASKSNSTINQSARKRATGKDEVAKDGKVYLTAGLYWSSGSTADLLKSHSNPPIITKSRSKFIGKGKGKLKEGVEVEAIDWKSFSPSLTLPPPIHFGESLLKKERDFRLPFDILRDRFDNNGTKLAEAILDGKELELKEKSRKPPPFKTISKNIYVDRKPDKTEHTAVCVCSLPKDGSLGCGEDCINRLMQYSCSPKTCPLGDKCSNLPLGMQTGVPVGKGGLRVIWTGNRGFGLKTMIDIKEGTFVLEYRGEIISRDESYRRVLTTYKDAKSFYFLDYDGDEVIDAGQRGNVSRFINHSCGPNVTVIRWRLADVEEYQMGIFALRDIPAGTELSYDYGWQDFGRKPSAADGAAVQAGVDPHRQRCYCGARVCSGWLGGKKEKIEKEKVDKTFSKSHGRKPTKTVEATGSKTFSKPKTAARKGPLQKTSSIVKVVRKLVKAEIIQKVALKEKKLPKETLKKVVSKMTAGTRRTSSRFVS